MLKNDGYPNRHWKIVAATWRSTLIAISVTGVAATAFTWSAVFFNGSMTAAAIADAICILVSWAGVFGLHDAYRYAQVHPYFERDVGDIDTFCRGHNLVKCLAHLDARCVEVGIAPLSAFGFNDDMAGETVVWHHASTGLITVEFLLQDLMASPNRIPNQSEVVDDLQHLADALRKADKKQIQFSLLLRHCYGTCGPEWEQRKGTAF